MRRRIRVYRFHGCTSNTAWAIPVQSSHFRRLPTAPPFGRLLYKRIAHIATVGWTHWCFYFYFLIKYVGVERNRNPVYSMIDKQTRIDRVNFDKCACSSLNAWPRAAVWTVRPSAESSAFLFERVVPPEKRVLARNGYVSRVCDAPYGSNWKCFWGLVE
jgi:hypothetical protein